MTEEIKDVHFLTAPSGEFNERNFHVYYESIAHFHEADKKIFFGEKYKCRFCPETNPKLFSKEAHTCPEFTGNKFFISNDECDTCNSIFSEYETHLANHSHFMRTLFGLRGKSKSLSLISNNQSISFKHDKNGLLARINHAKAKGSSKHAEGFTRKIDLNTNKQIFEFKFKKKQHIPLYLFKILNKIAFSIMPKTELDVGGFEKFTLWLRTQMATFSDDEPHKPYFYIYHNSLRIHKQQPVVMLFKKRREHSTKIFPRFLFYYSLVVLLIKSSYHFIKKMRKFYSQILYIFLLFLKL